MPPVSDDPAEDEHHALSHLLRGILAMEGERFRIGDMVEAFGARAFGAILFVFSMPNLLPLPPGSSTPLGIPLLLTAPQVALGVPAPWLPRTLADRTLPKADLARAFQALLPKVERVERLLAPRLPFMFGPVGDRLIGLVCTLLAMVLILPIPFGNMLPAASIAVLSLSLIQRDGLAALIGYALAATSAAVLVVMAGAVVAAVAALGRMIGL